MHFFASTLSVSGIALFYSRLFRRSLAQTISCAVFTVCILLYLLSIAGIPLRVSCALLMVLGWLCLLGSIVRFLSGRRRPSTENLVVLLVYALFAVFIYTYLYDKLAVGWDEFSHWMLTVKNMHHFNSLGLGAISSTEYQSYPPSLQLFECFYLIFNPDFNESGAFLGRTMLLISTLFAPAFGKNSHPLWGTAKLLILFTAPIAFYSSVYSMLYVDAALGMLFAHLFWLYYSEERFDRFFILHFSLSACVLALIKGAGIALVFLVLLAMLLDFIFGNPQPLRQIAKERRSSFLVGSALVFLIPLIAYFSWKLYLNFHHIGDFWKTGSAVSPQSLLALITSPQEYQVQTLSNFLYNIRTSFNLGRIPISFVRYPAVFLIVSIFAGVCAGNLRRGTIAGISLSFSYCMYVASVLITYLLLFSPGEAVGNASFRRYMNTQTLACCMCSLVLLLNPAVLSRRTSQPLPDIEILGLRFIPGAVLPALLALSFPFLSGSASTAIQLYCNARADMQFAIQHRADLSFFERKANEIENKEARIWYIHQTCNGDRYYVARMLAAPIRFNMREFSLAASNESMDNPYSVIKTLRQWSDELASYDYVYCDQITDTFITDYGDLFENRDDISAHAFYQVIPAGNGEDFVQLRLLERE